LRLHSDLHKRNGMSRGRRKPEVKGGGEDHRRLRLSMLVCELSMGGAARVVRDHAEAFASFADVTEIVFDRADGVDFAGGEVVSLDVKGGRTVIDKIAALGRRVRAYSRYKKSSNPQVSISHLEGAHLVDLLSPGPSKRVLVVHGSIDGNNDIRGFSGWLRRTVVIPTLYRRADAIVAVSGEIADELRVKGLARARTINNFFRIDAIEARSREPLSPNERALFGGRETLVTAGRLADQKKQAALLDMVARLKRDRPVSLFILGDGPLRDDLLGHARRLGVTVWTAWDGGEMRPGLDVYFMGARANPFPLIRASDLFLFPSGWEGFPLALCEAMVCETAVLSTDCPTGPREILAPHSGVPGDAIMLPEPAPFGMLMPFAHLPESKDAAIDHWAQTVKTLLDDPDRRRAFAIAARKRVGDFSREAIVPQWRALFEELAPA
jgi:glycosyltransferase involved in cell wall biosynthesis